jgi:hypothetical protein
MTQRWPRMRLFRFGVSPTPIGENAPSASGRSGGPDTLPLGCPTYSEEKVIGQRFGKLLVIEQAPSRDRHPMWLCVCDCGLTTKARAAHLRAGHARSCGCLRQRSIETGAATVIDMVGRVVGRLTVLERVGSSQIKGNSLALWSCRCSCGSNITVTGHRLRRHDGPRSCGCLRRDIAKAKMRLINSQRVPRQFDSA